MTRRLPEPQQRLQDQNLGFAHALRLNATQQGLAVMFAQFVVTLTLVLVQLAIDGLLQLLGEFLRHLVFRAAQDERAQRLAENRARRLVGIPHRHATG